MLDDPKGGRCAQANLIAGGIVGWATLNPKG